MTGDYVCNRCGKQINRGELIAILGEAPPSGLSAPIGHAEKIIADIGATYCRECIHQVIDKYVEVSSPVSD